MTNAVTAIVEHLTNPLSHRDRSDHPAYPDRPEPASTADQFLGLLLTQAVTRGVR